MAIKAYREFVDWKEGEDGNPFKDIEAGLILGEKKFKAKIRKLIDKVKVDEEVPQAKRLRAKVSIDGIIETCGSFYGKRREDLIKRGIGKQERQIAIYLSKVMSGQKSKEIGGYFGIKGPAVSEIIKGIEERSGEEIKLRKEIEFLKEKLLNEL